MLNCSLSYLLSLHIKTSSDDDAEIYVTKDIGATYLCSDYKLDPVSSDSCVDSDQRKSQMSKIRLGAYYVTNNDYDYTVNTPCSHSPPCPTMPLPQRSKSMSKVHPFCPFSFRKLYDAWGLSELKLQISIMTDKTVLELKQAIAEKSDVGADRQRLIYSGLFIVFAGPVHWTGKKTEIELNPTAKDRTTSCGCTNSEFFRLPVAMFVEKSNNRKKPV